MTHCLETKTTNGLVGLSDIKEKRFGETGHAVAVLPPEVLGSGFEGGGLVAWHS